VNSHLHIPAQDPTTSALDEFRRLRGQRKLTPEEARRLALHAAALFKDHYTKSRAYLPDAITLLTELAIHPDPALSSVGARALFPELVEWSADWFNPTYCRLYDRLFAQVIDICRHLPQNRALDFGLHGYGLASADDFLARREAQRAGRPALNPGAERVKKILVLSRITFGAEVAITSVVLRKMRQLYPEAEQVILGAPVVGQMFAGEDAVRVQDAHYPRGGSLLERFNSWPALTQTVADELAGLDADEYLIIDPDSRLTQLGLLPITSNEARYLFFESRGYGGEGDERISQLAARWLEERFGPLPDNEKEPALPFVSLSPQHNALADAVRSALRSNRRPLVCVNFGVGDNAAKLVGEGFEVDLLWALLEQGARVTFAKGVGDEERARADRHLGRLRARQTPIAEVQASDLDALPPASRLRRANLIAWQGELGAFCAVIAAADLYIGYDSAGQHIAAALGRPTIDIFADDSIPMVVTRWTPTGTAPVHVIEHYLAPQSTLDRTMGAYRAIIHAAEHPSAGGHL
jgi:hypothetical protein